MSKDAPSTIGSPQIKKREVAEVKEMRRSHLCNGQSEKLMTLAVPMAQEAR